MLLERKQKNVKIHECDTVVLTRVGKVYQAVLNLRNYPAQEEKVPIKDLELIKKETLYLREEKKTKHKEIILVNS